MRIKAFGTFTVPCPLRTFYLTTSSLCSRSRSLAFFSAMEAGDSSSLRLWSSLRRLSLHELNSIYGRLNVEFDIVEGESKYGMRASDFRQRISEQGWLQESTKKGMEGQVKKE